ncbi:TrmH family RNA methyltransferase [Solimicrobium silvestre]|uniref:rRNA methylase n=1 Tax=Solimicrobium silvestre TaxID=2099400 RepID=A0A2S9GWX5_9BURK|nr:RNA methyltransferase [Solimicrobium silvestre]PRC92224.1 rRNA methylase [Solimicrobium silvestre]
MKLITSRENALYKELKHLATSSQARRKANCTLLDGVHLCQSYLEQIGQPQWCVVSEASQHHPEIAALLVQTEHQLILADALYHALSQVEHGVGIFFVAQTPSLVLPEQITQTAVALDNLQDPGNLGSLLRSAAAAGIRHVFCSTGTVSAWSPKVMRAGMGAHFLLEIHENVDLLSLLKNTTIPVLATSSYATQTVYDCDLKQPLVWLFGHEGQGLSDELMAYATEQVTIPHQGQIESLNVAACAAICFFEQVRQNLK